jgi:hypothetical protein
MNTENIFDNGELGENSVVSILEIPTQHATIDGKIKPIHRYIFNNSYPCISVGTKFQYINDTLCPVVKKGVN